MCILLQAVFLDEVMSAPDQPDLELMVLYETRSLRDTRELLKVCEHVNQSARTKAFGLKHWTKAFGPKGRL